jgi:benzylsuccinate CoA-transferase BbsF subunit
MSEGIFAGLKVADFTWAAAGPIATKQLADNGATVVKVESLHHPDSVRLGGPFIDDKPGINRSGFFADFNSSKLSLAVNMGHPRAAEVIVPLVKWADVVAESFRPGVMQRWGFGYDDIRKHNPSIIMLSSSLNGEDGPWSSHPGFGAQGQALAGIHGVTGWPDRPPAAPKGAYTDSVSPRLAASALLAAMIHREKTGIGQHVRLSQVEATITLLTPQLLEFQIAGRKAERQGNDKKTALLHGVFRCLGDERWIAIEVENETQWRGLLDVLARTHTLAPALTKHEPWRGHERRVLEQAIEEATARWDAFVLMDELLAAGVPAGVALKACDLLDNPMLEDRRHFSPLQHPEMGTLKYNGPAYRFSQTPSKLTRAAPCLGQDSSMVLTELLALNTATIEDLRRSGVLE